MTNTEGTFRLKNVEPTDQLIITYTGYTAKTVEVKDENHFYIQLEIAQNELDVAIVQGYGTTTRRLSTGNIAKVTAVEIEKQPVMNPLLALQGKSSRP